MTNSRLSSLRLHLLVIVTLAMLPALLMVAHLGWQSRRHAELQTENEARRLAEHVEGQHRQAVDSARRSLQQLAATLARQRGNESASTESLRRRLLESSSLLNIGRVSTNGLVQQSALDFTPGLNVASNSWFRRVMQSQRLGIDNQSIEPVSGRPVILCAVPILPTNRPCQGVVFGALNLQWLQKGLPRISETLADAEVNLFNDEGLWLGGNAAHASNRLHSLVPSVSKNLPRTGETLVLTERTGQGTDTVLRVVHYLPANSPLMGSYIVVSVPMACIRAKVQWAMISDSAVLGLVAFLSLSLAWITSERLVLRRTRALVTATDRLAAGDLSARTGLPPTKNKNDEIGELARKFDSMAAQLETEHRERQQLEEQVRIAQKMEAMGLLAGGVAHDFNNLLQVISGSTSLAQRSVPANNPANHHLENVGQAAGRAAQLTRQLLAMSRQQPLNRAPEELNSLVTSLLQMIRRVIGAHIEVLFIRHHEPAWVNADRGQIEQILLNLCLNARDAMPKGGQLELSVHTVKITPNDPSHPGVRAGEYHELVVSDTGSGIAQEHLPRIFDPFFTTKPKDRGTGLGLSVVYGIVRQHEGHIRVASEAGFGAKFHVLLPKCGTPTKMIEAPRVPEPVAIGSETVLVVEDEDLVRELTVHILESAGYRVLAAPNGVEGCELFAKHQENISVVIMDAIMPRMGGREAAIKMREMRSDVAILFCSGYSGAAMELNHALPKNAPLLTKPFQPADLLKRVREVLVTEVVA